MKTRVHHNARVFATHRTEKPHRPRSRLVRPPLKHRIASPWAANGGQPTDTVWMEWVGFDAREQGSVVYMVVIVAPTPIGRFNTRPTVTGACAILYRVAAAAGRAVAVSTGMAPAVAIGTVVARAVTCVVAAYHSVCSSPVSAARFKTVSTAESITIVAVPNTIAASVCRAMAVAFSAAHADAIVEPEGRAITFAVAMATCLAPAAAGATAVSV